MFSCRPIARIPWLLALILLGASTGGAQTRPATGEVTPVAKEEGPMPLPKLSVTEHADDDLYDPTGMGHTEEELRSAPFSNDLTAVDYVLEEGLSADVSAELAAISTASPAAAAAGEERLNLRGFPTPILRNGFNRMGILETINIERTIMIQGPLVPVLGRAAPGGIQNFITTRPSARDRNKLEASATSLDRQRVTLETTGALIPKRLWQRAAAEWSQRSGPEEFFHEDSLTLSGSLTLRHSRAASSLFSVDYRRYDGTPTPGIPEYKDSVGQKVIGPARSLALFNANGPDAGVRRESLVLGAQFEGQINRVLSLRTAVEGWSREIAQDRFTSPILLLNTGLFEGIREPRHIAQDQRALATHVELTARFSTGKLEHKLMGYIGSTWGEYDRADSALTTADRNALPVTVRRFNPAAPDYYYPPYDPALYTRMLTDRLDSARYGSLELGDRMAFDRGRTVVTVGLRLDEVDLTVVDRKPGAALPETSDRTSQVSYHAGVNHQLVRNKVLLFASVSTAFDPTTPVDSRTGRIQDNETTLGYEGGIKGRAKSGLLEYSASAFLLYNQNIARRNPLYDDPLADLNHTQPQLVAAGEERFAGLRAELRYRLGQTVTVAVRGVHLDAVTTKSPALDAEVGNPISRLPSDTATLQVRYAPAKGAPGFNGGASLSYIGSYVANYEDDKRAYLAYPGYGLLTLHAGYTWKLGKRQLTLGLSLRNALDRDLLASNARVGAGRELGISARLMF